MLQAVLLLDLGHDRLDGRDLALVGSAGRDDDAVGLGLPLGGRRGAGQQLARG